MGPKKKVASGKSAATKKSTGSSSAAAKKVGRPASSSAATKKSTSSSSAAAKKVGRPASSTTKKATTPSPSAATKKSTTAVTKKATATTAKKKSKTPNRDGLFAEVNRVKSQLSCAVMWLKGMEDDDYEEDHVSKEYTKAQLAKAKLMMVPDNRRKEVQDADRWIRKICGDDDDDFGGFMMMNTGTGNNIIMSLGPSLMNINRIRTLPERFDSLVAITLALHRFDSWIYDNEMYGKGEPLDKVIQLLAKSWKELLKKSNDELGIDAEFTRPAVEHLMLEFDALCKESSAVSVKFQWK